MSGHRDDRPRIYLDNAATSWPKPPGVYDAVDRYQRTLGAPAGRGAYAEAVEVSALVDQARLRLARLVGLGDPSHVVFTGNGTDSLNTVIHGALRPGDHVVTTVIEHNSVLRPLAALEAAGTITVTYVGCDGHGMVDPHEVGQALRDNTRLVAISHASNVTGAIQPVAEVGRLTHAAGAWLLCDVAQTLGHMPLTIDALEADFLAGSGHKGLLGPLGTGVLAMKPAAAAQLESFRQGGTGTQSYQARQPQELPYKFESGNLNVPGIVGLAAGLEFIAATGLDHLKAEGETLTERLLEALREIEKLKVIGPTSAATRVPLVSVVIDGYDPQEVAASLDAAFRVQVRSGLHCAPAMHRALGTDRQGGTLRFSLGAFNTAEDTDNAAMAVRAIADMAT